jgi:hypothetical protein
MSKLAENVQKVEGFKIRIKNPKRRRLTSDYRYKRKASGDMTVSQLIHARLKDVLSEGAKVEAIDGDGNVVHGRMVVKNLRKTYS